MCKITEKSMIAQRIDIFSVDLSIVGSEKQELFCYLIVYLLLYFV